MNRSSICRESMKHRAQITKKLKNEFKTDVPLIVYWDEKLTQDLTRKTYLDCLPIIVSGLGIKQLIYIAKIPDGSGQSQANDVVLALEELGLAEKVISMSFDKTALNTGRKNSACIFTEAKFQTGLLYFACCHQY